MFKKICGVFVVMMIAVACTPTETVSNETIVIDAVSTSTPIAVAMNAPSYVGDLVNPPVHVQDFVMPASTGESMAFSALDGKWRMVFFGYLHCPDFCPLTLSEYKKVKRLLGDSAEQVTFVYVSVDGERDTPEAMQRYLANFDSSFVGFSGDDATLAQIQPDYGFYYSRRLDTGSQASYVIDHSTRSYLINPQGDLITTFTYDATPEAITEALLWYVNGGA
jgi:protein SCO1